MAWETGCDATKALFNWATACESLGSSGQRLGLFCLTRFLHANRFQLRLITFWHSRPGLPGAVDAIFEAGQLLGADRTAGVEFPGCDSDFRAEAEFAAIGELGRRVMQHDRRIDLVEEFARGSFILGHDRIGVVRTVIVDVGDRLV